MDTLTPDQILALQAGADALRLRAQKLLAVITHWHADEKTPKVEEARQRVAKYNEQAEILTAMTLT